MRKSIFIGNDIKIEKKYAALFARILKKLKSSQNIRFSIIYILKKIQKLTKSKATALINNEYEVFCDFSKKHRLFLRKIYYKNKFRWNHYFYQGIDFIDCCLDIRMHNYLDYRAMKSKFMYDIVLMKTINKRDYDDGIFIFKKTKDINTLKIIAPYIYDCCKIIFNHRKTQTIKPIYKLVINPPKDKAIIRSNFLICNDRMVFEDIIFRKKYRIGDKEKVYITPYLFNSNNPIEKNEILKLRNNKNVFFDVLLKFENHEKWFRVEGTYSNIDEGNAIFDGVFVDITILKRKKLFINLSKISYKHRARIKKEVLFEYLMKDDIVNIYGNLFNFKITHIPQRIFKFSKQINLLNIMNYDGKSKLLNLLSGLPTNPFEIHYINDYEDEFYYEIDGTVIYSNNKPIRVIGKAKNITKRKIKELEIISSSKLDFATGFYNYLSGLDIIQKKIHENKKGSILVIDIDDFNSITEMYGNMFGSIIIKEISLLINNIFRDDIIVRYYRDGFIIYMHALIDEAKERAIFLLGKLKDIYIDAVELSISAGLVDTDYSLDISQLIKIGGQMLLYSKSCGGGIVSTYRDIDSAVIKNLIVQNKNEVGNEYIITSSINDTAAFTIEILMKAKNFKSVLKILLKRLKDTYALERVGIYEHNIRNNESVLYCGWDEYGEQSGDEIFPIDANEIELILNSVNDDELKIDNNILSKFNNKLYNVIIRYSCYRQLFYYYNQKSNIRFFIIFGIQKYKQFWRTEVKRDLRVIANIMLSFLMKEHDKTMVQVKTDYLSNMSHEIRTPLNGIIGMTKIAKNILDDPERIYNALANIDLSSHYLLSLVNNILDMSKIESEKMKINKEPFLLANLIDDIENMMRVQADQKQIKFQVIRKFSNRLVIGDILRISQVIVNLLGNAFKFTSEFGHVVFHISEGIIDNDKSEIKFVIKDSGIGIRKDKTLKIFESFEQAHASTASQYGGSGLGLSISNSLVKLMGGNIEVKSEEGKGSEFYFTLTFNHDNNNTFINLEPRHKEEEYIPSLMFVGKRILLVEDDKLNLEIIKVLLENVGFKIEIANNGKEAIEMFAKSKLNYYDIILMDIKMPIMDGYEATTLIRSLCRMDSPTIPIIAMTAKAFEEDISEAFRQGMNSYITKPIDMKLLYQELEKILEQ